eukprot:1134442-Pelagomonas_calceolata.AAC.1
MAWRSKSQLSSRWIASFTPSKHQFANQLEAMNPGKKDMAVLLRMQAITSSSFYRSRLRFRRTAGGCLQPSSHAVCPRCAPHAA